MKLSDSFLVTLSTPYYLYSPHFALVVRFTEGLSLVVGVLALAEGDFHLRESESRLPLLIKKKKNIAIENVLSFED